MSNFLARPRPGDTLFFYFEGRRIDRGNRVYLVPSDGTMDDPSSWISASTLSDYFHRCRADVKMLAIDAPPLTVALDTSPTQSLSRSIPADRLLVQLSDPDSRSFLLSSCRAGEASNFWSDRGEGVFSYWLTRGLDGAADLDGDGLLTFDELADFTRDRITRTVERYKMEPQTPARSPTPIEAAAHPLAALKAETAAAVCKRIATHLDEDVRLHGFKVVAMRDEFLIKGQGENREDRLATFALPHYLAGLIKQELVVRAEREPKYQVLGGMRVMDRAALADGCVAVEDVEVPPAPDAIIGGKLSRNDLGVEVQSELTDPAGEILTKPGGFIPRDENNLGNCGQTFDLSKVPSDAPDRGALALEQAKRPHPLLDETYPYRLEVFHVDGPPNAPPRVAPEPKKLAPRRLPSHWASRWIDPDPRRLFIEAEPNEFVMIRVTNKTSQRVAVCLLVDGINTNGMQPAILKDGDVDAWIIDAESHIDLFGWYTHEGPAVGDESAAVGKVAVKEIDSQFKWFHFEDLAESVAARANSREKIGLITAGFYPEVPKGTRTLGMGAVNGGKTKIKVEPMIRGKLIATLQLGYGDKQRNEDLFSRP